MDLAFFVCKAIDIQWNLYFCHIFVTDITQVRNKLVVSLS